MTQQDWSRPHWTRDDAKAMLLYFVFGAFPETLQLDVARHGSAGLPGGVELQRMPRTLMAHWDGHPLRGALGDLLREEDPAAFAAARAAPDCIMLRGEVSDAPTLDYLRDTLGAVGALLDVGGVAVVDPQILGIWSANGWRARYEGEGVTPLRDHLLIVCHDDQDGGAWIKTRGLRKFARPDVSIRRVPEDAIERAGAVAAHVAELEMRGMRFGAGSILDIEGVPGGMTARPGGSLDDPQFNNVHVEFVWPGS